MEHKRILAHQLARPLKADEIDAVVGGVTCGSSTSKNTVTASVGGAPDSGTDSGVDCNDDLLQ